MTIIRSNGKTEEVIKDAPITILEISKILNGLVEPLFVGEFWVFTCKNAERLQRDLNEKGSNILNIKIYGDIVLAKDDELTPSFFFPPEMLKEIKTISNKVVDNMMQDYDEDLPAEDQEKVLNNVMDIAYNIIMTVPFDDLIKNFTIYDDGIKTVKINSNFEDRLKTTDAILNHFVNLEEYDKCINIQKFKDKLINFYKEF